MIRTQENQSQGKLQIGPGETLDFLSMVGNSCSFLEEQTLGEAEEDVEKGYGNTSPDTKSVAPCGQGQDRRKCKSLLSMFDES